MVGGSERFFEPCRAILADRHEAIRETGGIAAANAIEALAHRFGHGRRHALTGQPRQLSRQSMGLLALDIQAHINRSTISRDYSTSTLDSVNAAANRVTQTDQVEAAVPLLPDKPSIAVLPFTDMSGDPKQEFLADGIAEDISPPRRAIPHCS